MNSTPTAPVSRRTRSKWKRRRDGIVSAIDNERLARLARLTGAPKVRGAGVDLFRKLGDAVRRGEPLYRVYAEFASDLRFARAWAAQGSGYAHRRARPWSKVWRSSECCCISTTNATTRRGSRAPPACPWLDRAASLSRRRTEAAPAAPLSARVVLLRSLHRPNEKLVELLLAARAARALGAVHLTLVAPYLAYMRQDMAFAPGEAVSQRIVGALLADLFDAVVTIDPHLHRVEKLNEAVPAAAAIALSAAPLIGMALRDSQSLMLGPDAEAEPWVRVAAASAGCAAAVCRKVRHGDRDVEVELARDRSSRAGMSSSSTMSPAPDARWRRSRARPWQPAPAELMSPSRTRCWSAMPRPSCARQVSTTSSAPTPCRTRAIASARLHLCPKPCVACGTKALRCSFSAACDVRH